MARRRATNEAACSRDFARQPAVAAGPGSPPTHARSKETASLIDEYKLWTFPVVLGRGKHLFEAGAKAGALRLIASQASRTGVVMSTYVPAGEIPLGSFAQAEPSAKEVERRAKLAREAGGESRAPR